MKKSTLITLSILLCLATSCKKEDGPQPSQPTQAKTQAQVPPPANNAPKEYMFEYDYKHTNDPNTYHSSGCYTATDFAAMASAGGF